MKQKEEEAYLWISMAVGALFGGLFGNFLFGSLLFGVGFGLCVGLSIGNLVLIRKRKRKR